MIRAVQFISCVYWHSAELNETLGRARLPDRPLGRMAVLDADRLLLVGQLEADGGCVPRRVDAA